jgi:hypothetical protein
MRENEGVEPRLNMLNMLNVKSNHSEMNRLGTDPMGFVMDEILAIFRK